MTNNSTSLQKELPPELIQEILDWLCDNQNALASCSLVSHAWHTMTRSRLFRDITLSLRCTDSRLTNFQHFLKQDGTIPMYIRSLRLQCAVEDESKRYRPVLSVDEIATLLSILPHLSELEIAQVILQPSDDYDTLPIGTFQLDKLTLYRLNDSPTFSAVPDAISWLQLLSLFSHIKYFKSFMNRLLPSAGSMSRKSPLGIDPRMLSFLQVDCLEMQGLVPAFVDKVITNALADNVQIRSLYLQTSCDFLDRLECVGPILSKSGPHIRSIRIDVRDTMCAPASDFHLSAIMSRWGHLQLAKCDNLESLHLVCLLINGKCTTAMSLEACVQILTRTPKSLRSLRITVKHVPSDVYDTAKICSTSKQFFWDHMEQLPGAFPKLENITFDAIQGEGQSLALPEIARMVRENLPGLDERGLLQIEL